MNNKYKIDNPGEFSEVIVDILIWYKDSGLTNLVIALQGDLGVGKTTFTQMLAKDLDVEEEVTSPTFAIMKQYDLSHEYFDKLVHIDTYRFESESEVSPLGFVDVFKQPRNIICIEWPEIISSIIPEKSLWIKIENKKEEERVLTMSFRE